MTRLLATTALAVVMASVAAPALAQQRSYSSIVVFGDSLSDTGNLPAPLRPGAPYVGGRFSNGPVWAEQLGTLRGTPVQSVALGGARSGRVQPIDLQFQLDQYLAARPQLSGDALYAVWIGGNDYLAYASNPVGDPFQVVGTTVGNTVAGATRLIQAGARNLIVLGLPDLGSTPGVAANGSAAAAQASQITDVHNANLQQAVRSLRAGTGASITYVDIGALIRSVVADPSAYGLSNVTVPCLGTSGPTGACATADAAAATLFFDPIHPTVTGHQGIAQYVNGTFAALYDAPAAYVATSQLGLRLFELAAQGVQSRMAAARTGRGDVGLLGSARAGADGRYGLYAFGGYVDGERDRIPGQFGYDYDAWNVGAGLDYQVDENFLAGIALGYADGSLDLEGGAGSADAKSYSVQIYGTAAWGPWYADGSMGYSYEDYGTLERSTRFAPYPLAEADTDGSTYGLSGRAGYVIQAGGFGIGPEVGLRYLNTEVEGFTEEDAGPLALTVERSRAESLIGSLGVQASGRFGDDGLAVVPALGLAYEHEFLGDGRSLTARLANGEVGMTEVGAGDRGRIVLDAGVTVETAAGLLLSVGYRGEPFGGSDREDHAVVGRVRIGF
ncbi:autotransporter domain-containing protein [Rhodospirillum centenum]|uniref:Outer membrane autotransporter barrel domain protein n=1 Tax=Rhodospirillum centenum (strain ATCC 51521 / SW) TaxID=414684 RepID=B6IWX4_RHOCS|nr:autotransporter domain-containing protein [Rhodospirillum centenum]ACJ00798.1 outer membrane autotransporter barrel domain protein [Rhodospirillum centenum SW]